MSALRNEVNRVSELVHELPMGDAQFERIFEVLKAMASALKDIAMRLDPER